jgi:uncharacterized protein (DUF1501 family)
MNRFMKTPAGMTRRHFLEHLAGASALALPAVNFTNALAANAKDLKRRHKSAILLYMGGGPSTIDIWDMKPGMPTGGNFKPIATNGDAQICEHMPLMARQMKHMAIVRSMSTREADHTRGRYYMHTGYVPNPTIDHPSYGSVVSHELATQLGDLQIPPFVSIGGGSVGPGFLGMTYAPFVVDYNGDVRNAATSLKQDRLEQRMYMLASIEKGFIAQNRGDAAVEHEKVLQKTVSLFTSKQMGAFKFNNEPKSIRDLYGQGGFANGCLIARRLVEEGVPFVEIDLGGWDMHNGVFPALERKLAELDKSMAGLVEDLNQRGLLEDTVVLWMGEFGRTPRINATAGRDHWARSWSVVAGGSGIKGGTVVGATNEDGSEVTTDPYKAEDLMASVLKALGISLETTFTSRNNRPMKIANGGRVIKELFA